MHKGNIINAGSVGDIVLACVLYFLLQLRGLLFEAAYPEVVPVEPAKKLSMPDFVLLLVAHLPVGLLAQDFTDGISFLTLEISAQHLVEIGIGHGALDNAMQVLERSRSLGLFGQDT